MLFAFSAARPRIVRPPLPGDPTRRTFRGAFSLSSPIIYAAAPDAARAENHLQLIYFQENSMTFTIAVEPGITVFSRCHYRPGDDSSGAPFSD